jgi:DNA-binding HxlR family transcriptional regulator
MRRKSFEGDSCPIRRSLDVVGDWWSLLIVRDAFAGVRRYSDFQRSLGSAKNILATRLKALVAQGILTTEPASDGSSYQEYALTEKGRALRPVMVALSQWGRAYLYQPGEVPSSPLTTSPSATRARASAASD